MHGPGRRFAFIALLLAATLAPASASASQPASHGALAALVSPGESMARLWAWVTNLLPGHRIDLAPMATRPATSSFRLPMVRPYVGSVPDPNGG
jgi:hypothetical protein